MTFPVRVKHRKHEAVIYGRTSAYRFYRVAHYVNGKRILRNFPSYALARTAAKTTLRALAKGSPVSALNPSQARDAIAGLERLEGFFKSTEKRVSLNAAVADYVEAASKLQGVTLATAVTGYLHNAAVVSRKDVSEAVAEFVAEREKQTKSVAGKRPD